MKYIPQMLVNQYVIARNNEQEAKKQRAVLRTKLLEYFETGCECPADSKYLIVHSEVEVSDMDWKKYASILAHKLYGKLWRREVQKAVDNAGVKLESKLNVVINPALAEEE